MTPAAASPPPLARSARLDRLRTAPRSPGEASFFFCDPHFKVDTAKILPGEYYADQQGHGAVVTVLGSCVSACLRDRETGIGGMNHFMLPDEGKPSAPTATSAGGRYGVHAMELLINQILKLGGRARPPRGQGVRRRQRAAGLHALQRRRSRTRSSSSSTCNIERIPIVARDLLDVWPRKIYFFPRSGKVMVQAPAQDQQRHHRCASATTARASSARQRRRRSCSTRQPHRTRRTRIKVLIVDDSALIRGVPHRHPQGAARHRGASARAADAFEARD